MALLGLVAQLCLTLWDPMDAAWSATVHEDSPGKNTGVGYYAVLQGIFPTQGSNPGLPHWRWILHQLSHHALDTSSIPGLGRPHMFLRMAFLNSMPKSIWMTDHLVFMSKMALSNWGSPKHSMCVWAGQTTRSESLFWCHWWLKVMSSWLSFCYFRVKLLSILREQHTSHSPDPS